MAIVTGITLPIVLAVVVFVATVVIGPFQEDVKEGVSVSEPPVRVGVEESWNEDVDMEWVFDRPLPAQAVGELMNLPTDGPSVVGFATAHGGLRFSKSCLASAACDAARTRFKLALTGRRRGEVRITDIVGRVLERREPPKGALLSGPTAGAEEIEPGVLLFGENSTVERLKSLGEDGRPGRAYFDEKFVHLALNEPIVFEVITVSTWDVDWELVVKLSVDGKAEETVVRSDGTPTGKPFRNPGKIYDPPVYKGSYKCEVGDPTCGPLRW
ncbi:hypothetical protein E1286_37190 [Nonomuraea terrae]|uniref:Uncharacterized protein n=1 Tax=Nonomuraea terrae TaxID=2530383 RepID=A0A4R4XZV4_9ACTN|nr:hypothetical protein [Nonomuraea terrae]TDD37451.1 hypothetical protein E1286_37190 [Nonomuraea terrae]